MVNQEDSQSPETATRFFYGYVVVAAALCILTVMYGTRLTYGVFFKPIIAEFDWTRALISGAFAISMIFQGLLAIVIGGLTDRFGPRLVMTLCGFVLGVGYLLLSQINAAWQLYLVYSVIIGIGMGGVFVPLLSTIAKWFIKRRSMMTGIAMTGIGIGQLIAPPVTSWLIFIYNWRMSYLILGIAVLVIVMSVAQLLRRDPKQMGQVPYGENKGEEHGFNQGTVGFSLKEAAYTRQFWMTFATLFCLGFSLLALMVHIVPHATDLGTSAASAAYILATAGGAHLLGGVVLGNSADRIGNRPAFIICFILMSVALFWFVPVTTEWMLYLLAFVFGFGGGGGATLMSPLVAELFGLRSHGLILGFMTLGFTSGAAVGPFIAGLIFDVTVSYQLAFIICAAVGVVGLILAAVLRPVKKLEVKT